MRRMCQFQTMLLRRRMAIKYLDFMEGEVWQHVRERKC